MENLSAQCVAFATSVSLGSSLFTMLFSRGGLKMSV